MCGRIHVCAFVTSDSNGVSIGGDMADGQAWKQTFSSYLWEESFQNYSTEVICLRLLQTSSSSWGTIIVKSAGLSESETDCLGTK